MKVSIPGKTFLFGEYLALEGGPAALACTEPRFVCETSGGKGNESPFHPLSPAFRWLEREGVDSSDWVFRDPHRGRGGLGASSAEFLAAWMITRSPSDKWDWQELVRDYREVATWGESRPPSGLDVVAQFHGSVVEFNGDEFCARSWPFPNLAFTLLRTGRKLATHNHLQDLRGRSFAALRPLAIQAQQAMVDADEAKFVWSVQSYGEALSGMGLQAAETLESLEKIRLGAGAAGHGLRAAKGCGAMGADILLLLHDRLTALQLRNGCESSGWAICGTDEDLAAGLRVI